MNISLPECYAILGVPPGTPYKAVQRQYKKLSSFSHPDKPSGDSELFYIINTAFEVIKSVHEKYGIVVKTSSKCRKDGGVFLIHDGDSIIAVEIPPNVDKGQTIFLDKIGKVTII